MTIFIIIISAVVIAVVMGFIIKMMSGKIAQLKNEIASKDIAIERAAQNLKALTNHAGLIQKIRTSNNDFIKRIGAVKENEDEKINDILRDLIDLNNGRVPDRKNNNP